MIVLKTAQEKLLSALQSVSGIVERRHTLPVLANVLLRKNGSEIEFTTSDLEIQVRTRDSFDGDASTFATTVGARKLIDILRSLPSDQLVTLSANQNKLTLQAASPCKHCPAMISRWCKKRPISALCSRCRKPRSRA
jgi:DNA polymerase-3 subunit beta